MKTITANIPARTIKGFTKNALCPTGTKTYPARIETFTQSDDGKWSSVGAGAMFESEVIDVCRRATNWAQIKTAHFCMADINKTDSWM